ncbi:MAG TPA: hypothetical protein VGH98_01510 [Gemmatimonadaceae bacterium]|jgi:hypothetical protein
MPLDSAAALPGGGRANGRFRAVLNAVVPEAAALRDEEWREAQSIIGRALAGRPAAVRWQIWLFMRSLDVASLVRYGRPLAALSVSDATQLLEALSRSRLLLLRRGVWGVRTLALMGYYARAEAARAIGYRASAAGWAARSGRDT